MSVPQPGADANINLEAQNLRDDIITNTAEILSRSKLSLNHPSKVVYGKDLFASVDNAQLDSAQRSRYTGKLKISPTSAQLGGLSSFLIDPGAWMGKFYIVAQLPAPARYTAIPEGWLFSLIDYVSFSSAGSSSISQLRISGRSMFDLIMTACETQEKRNHVIQLAGDYADYSAAAGTSPITACIPLHFLFASINGKSSLGFDTGVLRSQIIFSIQWKNLYEVMWTTSTAITFPSTFSQLYMRVHDQVILERDLIARQSQMDPSFIYSVPFKYTQSFQTQYTFNSASDQAQFNLSSFPRGMLQAIIISMTPQQYKGVVAQTNTGLAPLASYPMSNVKLLYLGQYIYNVDFEAEQEIAQEMMDDDGSSLYNFGIYNPSATNLLFLKNYVTIIPFVNRIDTVLRDQLQLVSPSFGGSQIQVQITPSAQGVPTRDNTGARSFYSVTYPQIFDINFTYVFNALLETSNAVMSLQLD
jgi:hypothetical protein